MENLNPLNSPSTTPIHPTSATETQKEPLQIDRAVTEASQEILKNNDIFSSEDLSLKEHKITQEVTDSSKKIDDLAYSAIQTETDDDADPFSTELLEDSNSEKVLFKSDAALDAKLQSMSREGIVINFSNATTLNEIQKVLKKETQAQVQRMMYKLTADLDNPFSLVDPADDDYDFIIQENTVIAKESEAEVILDALVAHGHLVGIDLNKPLHVIVVSDDVWEEFKERLAEFRHKARHEEVKEPVRQERTRESENVDREREVTRPQPKREEERIEAETVPVTVLDERLQEKAAVEESKILADARQKDEDYITRMRRIQEQEIFKANLKYEEKIKLSDKEIKRRLTGGR